MKHDFNPKTASRSVISIDTRKKWFNWSLVILCFVVLLAVRLQVNHGTTGDEPYYLLMDYSLIHDHDLNLSNNFKHHNFLSFYPNPNLQPQGTPVTTPGHPGIYSTHGFGLSVFLLPGFAIAEKSGAVLEMALLATLVVYLNWVWTFQITKNRLASYLTAGLLAICYFFNGLVGAIYPDMFLAAVILAGLIIIERFYRQPKFEVLLGIILGFAILVHFKSLIFLIPMLFVLAYKQWTTSKKLPWRAVLIVALFFGLYELSLYHMFGEWNISTVEHGQPIGANPYHTISAMLFDSNRGLLIYNPVLLLLLVGLPLWLKKHSSSLGIALIVLVPSILVLAIIPNWDGSAAPTGRYIMEFIPAFIPAITYSLIYLRQVWQRIVIGLLAILTFLISIDATLQRFPIIADSNPPAQAPLFTQIQHHTGLVLNRYIPTYAIQQKSTILVSSHKHILLAACYLICLTLLAYGLFLSGLVSKIRSSWRVP